MDKWLISELQQDKEGEIHFTFIPIQEYKKAWGNTDLGERDPRRMLIRMLLHLYDHLPTERNLSWNDFEKALLYIDIELNLVSVVNIVRSFILIHLEMRFVKGVFSEYLSLCRHDKA